MRYGRRRWMQLDTPDQTSDYLRPWERYRGSRDGRSRPPRASAPLFFTGAGRVPQKARRLAPSCMPVSCAAACRKRSCTSIS